MGKKVVAVDFDDVVFDFNGHFVPWHNKHFGTTLSYKDINSHVMEEVYKCDTATILERVRTFSHCGEHELVLPIGGAKEALRRLKNNYSLRVVTARAESFRPHVEEWNVMHFSETFDSLHFTNAFSGLHKNVKRLKSSVCKEIDASVLIEDAIGNAFEVAGQNIPVLLADRPWNQHSTLPHGIHRMHTWNDIVDWIETNV